VAVLEMPQGGGGGGGEIFGHIPSLD